MMRKIIEKGLFKGLQQKVGKEKAKEAHKLFFTVLEENKSWATDKPTEFNLIVHLNGSCDVQSIEKV